MFANRMPEDLPDRMSEDMPEDMPDRMPEDMPEDLPDRMPDRVPEDLPDGMPEDMSDRMPEDLPVTKRINVMVGITRSKVVFSPAFCNKNMLELPLSNHQKDRKVEHLLLEVIHT